MSFAVSSFAVCSKDLLAQNSGAFLGPGQPEKHTVACVWTSSKLSRAFQSSAHSLASGNELLSLTTELWASFKFTLATESSTFVPNPDVRNRAQAYRTQAYQNPPADVCHTGLVKAGVLCNPRSSFNPRECSFLSCFSPQTSLEVWRQEKEEEKKYPSCCISTNHAKLPCELRRQQGQQPPLVDPLLNDQNHFCPGNVFL